MAGSAEPAEEVPAWLQGIASGEETTSDEGLPDWLAQTMISPSPFAETGEPPAESSEPVMEEAVPAEFTDDFEGLPAMEAEQAAPADDIPDWLKDIVRTDETQETYAWERESFDLELEKTGAEETFIEEMPGEPAPAEMALETAHETAHETAPEMAADADEAETVDKWWERDTGSFERPVFPAAETVDEMAVEGVQEPEMAAERPVEETLYTMEPEMEIAWPVETPAEAQPEPVAMAEAFAARLDEARGAMRTGDLETALAGYRSLINEKSMLPEVIADLRAALDYDHAVNIDIWASLGDAYAGNNNLQSALDAYTKAEELLR
jgi:hypothetical protein